MKQLLTSKLLIDHMKAKGITFNYLSEEDAVSYLKSNNYYMKVASYRFNYQKYPVGSKNEGKYICLDFAYLVELYNIDCELKEICLNMCLDIEHFLKVALISEAEKNDSEDGYYIVKRYLTENDKTLNNLSNLFKRKNSAYNGNLIKKYYPYFPLWVFVEIITFGQTTYLCDVYNKEYNHEICENTLLNSVRDLRNDTAHGNCFINHLWTEGNPFDPKVKAMIKSLRIVGNQSLNKKMKNKCMYDISCLLLAYDKVVTDASVKAPRYNALLNLVNNRMLLHKDWFISNSTIVGSYKYLEKIVNYFCK